MHGGALLGVAYRMSRRISPVAATAISTIQSMPLSGYGNNGLSSFTALDDNLSHKSSAEAALPNFQLYRSAAIIFLPSITKMTFNCQYFGSSVFGYCEHRVLAHYYLR